MRAAKLAARRSCARAALALTSGACVLLGAGTVAPAPARTAGPAEPVVRAPCVEMRTGAPALPRWARARRMTILMDSVLLGARPGIRAAMPRWRIDAYGRPALMIRIAERELRTRRRRLAPLVVVGLGHNSLWEKGRRRFGYWSSRFDREARRLVRTARRLGAEQIVWVTLREPKPRFLTPLGRRELHLYSWYFPWVNQRLRRLDRERPDVVLADWTAVSGRRGLTYDSIHTTAKGAALMGATIKRAVVAEACRQVRASGRTA
ncbi:MAG TPA: hypothetical protein VFR97_13875 [Capillimicrobium sp.]|nr:hypothetical protein [Capillimicrobium sp.]